MTDGVISIKEIIKRHGISYSTLNYYTNIGLLSVIKRNRNARLYKEEQVEERLRRISQLKNEGYPLCLIKRELGQ